MNRKILCMTYRNHELSVNEEECRGDCYAYDDVLKIRSEDWTVETLKVTISHLMQIHGRICGNAQYRLGVDLDEQSGTYIGTFLHFGALDTCCDATLTGVVEKLADAVNSYFASPDAKRDAAVDSGLGRGACAYGEDEALIRWMVSASGADLTKLGGSIESAVSILS